LVNLSIAECNRAMMDDDELIVRLAGGDDRALRDLSCRGPADRAGPFHPRKTDDEGME
jgi:hypothetical protein